MIHEYLNFGMLGLEVVILIVLILIFYLNKKKTTNFNEQEYVVAIKTLQLTIDCYNKSILTPFKEQVQASYDLNPESPTNAIKKFDREMHELITNSAKEILKNYISVDSRKVLMKYYNIDALTLFVLTNLKG